MLFVQLGKLIFAIDRISAINVDARDDDGYRSVSVWMTGDSEPWYFHKKTPEAQALIKWVRLNSKVLVDFKQPEDGSSIAVDKITDEARAAIEACGGAIDATKKPGKFMVMLPDGAEPEPGDSHSYYIALPGVPPRTLEFRRASDSDECSLDLWK